MLSATVLALVAAAARPIAFVPVALLPAAAILAPISAAPGFSGVDAKYAKRAGREQADPGNDTPSGGLITQHSGQRIKRLCAHGNPLCSAGGTSSSAARMIRARPDCRTVSVVVGFCQRAIDSLAPAADDPLLSGATVVRSVLALRHAFPSLRVGETELGRQVEECCS
jgi:hypothetical protein